MATPSTFLWGQGGEKLSPADVARNRAMASYLMKGRGKPKTSSEGVTRLSEALLHNVLNKRASRAESKGKEGASAIMASLMGGSGMGSSGGQPTQLPTGGLDRDALHQAQMMAESAGNPNAVSPAGARGLMQIMPDTAANPGFGMQPMVNIDDPAENEKFGRGYMDKMLGRYGGDQRKALVAYNWGAGNADKWDGNMQSLPAETRGYINKIMGGQQMAQAQPQAQPQQGGGINPKIMELLNNQWASPGQRSIAKMLMGQNADRRKLTEQRGYDAGLLQDKRSNTAELLAAGNTREDALRDEERAYEAANPKQTGGITEYEYAKENGFPGSYIDFQQAKKGKGFSMTMPDGTTVQMGGGSGSGQPKLTVDAAKNAGYLIRTRDSQEILNSLENQGTDLQAFLQNKLPFSNYAQTEDYQRYDQAKRDFVNAILRRESGAVISDSEFANAEQQYFPQPGQGAAVIAQKRRNRDNAIAGLKIGAGGAKLPEQKPLPTAGNLDDNALLEKYK